MATADAVLRKLRKLDSNMICPNCETRAPNGVGFGNVCVKYKTFVCDLCKTSHQAISHRVKSITMSNWTTEEVNELTDKNAGGNAAAQHIWLKNAPRCGQRYQGGARPKEGDRIEIFKQFVLDCYEYGKFKADSPYVPSSTSSDVTSSTVTPVTSKPSSPVPPQRQAQQSIEVNFFEDDSRAVPSPAQAVKLPSASKAASSTQEFDPFGTSQPAVSSASTSKKQVDLDPFGISFDDQSNNSKKSQHGNYLDDLMQISALPGTSASNQSSNFADFGAFTSAPVAVAPAIVSTNTIPSFDPFGSEVLTPTSNSASSPGNNVFHFANGNANNSNKTTANVMDMFGGMSYDSNNSPAMHSAAINSGMMRGSQQPMGYGTQQQPAMNQWGARSAMNPGMGMNTGMGMGYNSSAAISQIDILASQSMQPRPAMGVGMGMGMSNSMGYPAQRGMGGTSGISAMNGMSGMGGMGMGMGQPRPTSQQDKFDFLQDTMKKHLNNNGPGRF